MPSIAGRPRGTNRSQIQESTPSAPVKLGRPGETKLGHVELPVCRLPGEYPPTSRKHEKLR